jgi:O-antigen/teichoic acid export membrane protein
MTGPSEQDRPAATMRQSVVHGARHLVIRQGVAIGLKLVGLLLITRALGPERYGAFVAASQIYAWLMLVMCSGISIHLVRATAIDREAIGTAYAVLGALSVIAVSILAGAGLSLDVITNVPGAGLVAGIFALAAPLQLMTLPATAQLERAMRFGEVARVEMVSLVGYYLLAIILILAGLGPAALAAGYVLQQGLALVLTHRALGSRPHFALSAPHARTLAATGLSYSTATLLWNGRTLVLPFIVGPALGATGVGLVGMTIGLCDTLTSLKSIAWRLSLAALRTYKADIVRLRAVLAEGTDLQMLLLGALLLGFGWLGPIIVPMLFGARWLPILDLYPFIALGYFTNAVFNMHASVLTLLDRNRDIIAFNGAHLLLFAAAAWLLLPRLGMLGYGLAEIAAFPAYALLIRASRQTIGATGHARTALWWGGVTLGLFWWYLGWAAILAPFLVLLLPSSRHRLVQLYRRFRPAPAQALPETAIGEGRRHFLFLRTERPETDFRLALAQELAALGHHVTYIYLRRRPAIFSFRDMDVQATMSLPRFLVYLLREHARRPGLVVFNSTNLNFPGLSLLIRALVGGIWCFDLHDDLVYGATGWRRRRAEIALKLLAAISDVTLAVSPLLAERVPGAVHLGNASALPFEPRAHLDTRDILILASIDDRFDFEFMQALAALDGSIHYTIRGHVSANAAGPRSRLVALMKAAANIRHDGGYATQEIGSILARHDVTVAPYVMGALQTRYIDPLRYYHCLRAGLELITTAIPAARLISGQAHVVETPEQALTAIHGLRNGAVRRRNADPRGRVPDWRDRATTLLAILDEIEQRRRAAMGPAA